MAEPAGVSAGDETGALRAEVARLHKIIDALINRAEHSVNGQGSDYSLFQATVLLEEQVRRRTRDLETALRENESITRELAKQWEEDGNARLATRRTEEAKRGLEIDERLRTLGQPAGPTRP